MFCVSLIEKNLRDLQNRFKELASFTDLFEIRLDALSPYELSEEGLRSFFKGGQKLVFTFRSPLEGGLRKVAKKEREKWLFWALSQKESFLVDFEWQEFKEYPFSPGELEKVLFSYHLFDRAFKPGEAEDILKEMSEKGVRWAKLISTPSAKEEALGHLELLQYASRLGIKLISFGMGEAGKFTRLLCLFFGSPYTYVAASADKKAAPGQVDITTAKKIYQNLKELF